VTFKSTFAAHIHSFIGGTISCVLSSLHPCTCPYPSHPPLPPACPHSTIVTHTIYRVSLALSRATASLVGCLEMKESDFLTKAAFAKGAPIPDWTTSHLYAPLGSITQHRGSITHEHATTGMRSRQRQRRGRGPSSCTEEDGGEEGAEKRATSNQSMLVSP
jgi:hypothetical protein